MLNQPYHDGMVQPLVLAHQGDSANAPANTMIAFEEAVAVGADALELDIHWTRDNVVVVSHDATVNRLSDGQGAIRDFTLSELKRLDFGYRFSFDGGRTFPYRGRGVTIPTLREVLEALPHVRVNMDIKPKQPASLKQLLVDLDATRAFARVMIASFHHRVLQVVRQIAPSLATSASPLEVARFRFWPSSYGRHVPFQALQVPVRYGGLTVVTAGLVASAHACNTQVHVWTVDDAHEMNTLLRLGVDGIVTNRPALGVRIRDEYVAATASAVRRSDVRTDA